ncbi:hypothetical protein QBC34DRAFT_438791 [Podospora aff. communis PSN243]|uniref:Rhodopsin domain-containing protein n=1 Tax=Podospora aff. communis PSN243 TaxID=3040156 RepID=A0AAV9GJX4_9PEZI|nr:hypothetical protein QBC34DRAFT_438791 [Podospora aff. communis PSN243]
MADSELTTPGPPRTVPPGFDPAKYQAAPLLNQRSPLLALTIFFIVFSWICSLARLYVRFIVQRAPGWDDFFILSTTMGSVVLCIMTNLGLGRPMFTLTPPELEANLKAVYITMASYPLSSTFIKTALLLQYLRVLTGPRIRMLCRLMLVLTVLLGIAFAICSWFACYPVHAFWQLDRQPDAFCWGFGSRETTEFRHAILAQVISTAVADFIVFVIPARLYFQPSTPRATRLSLLGLFSLGLCANLCSVWRVVYIIRTTAIHNDFDPPWDNPMAMGLASYEVHLAAVCAALPVLWPVLRDTWNRICVTREVTVTHEDGVFVPKHPPARMQHCVETVDVDVEMQSTTSQRDLVRDHHDDKGPPQAEDWNPFVGDERTGLGESETVVEALKRRGWFRGRKMV